MGYVKVKESCPRPSYLVEECSEKHISDFRPSLPKTKETQIFSSKEDGQLPIRPKFAALVQDLKDFIDNLEDITKSFQSLEQQRRIITTEIDSISDVHSLRLLQLACSENSDPISDAASQRLLQLENGSTRDYQSNALANRMGSLSIGDSYHTAPSHNAGITSASFGAVFDELVITDIPQRHRLELHIHLGEKRGRPTHGHRGRGDAYARTHSRFG